MLVDSHGRVTLNMVSSLLTVNPENDTFGVHPRTNTGYKFLDGNKVVLARDITYTSGGDLEEDVSGANITGKRYTVLTYTVSNTLKLRIQVFSDELNDNPNTVVLDREVILD